MVALLVAMAVTAVWMAALLPAWRQQMQREKETELIFRGEAIARAIYLYRQRHGGTLPPDLDTLVEQRFLRRKYIDPITGEDFVLVGGATASGFGDGGLQGGIIGVRSRSNETSIRIYQNQQTYSQWPFDFTLEQLRAGGGMSGEMPGGMPGPVEPGVSGAGPGGGMRFGGPGRGGDFGPMAAPGAGGRGRSGLP
ncbi:MAG: hypothetical protein DIU54_004015 [Acidobacteriota bacterium]